MQRRRESDRTLGRRAPRPAWIVPLLALTTSAALQAQTTGDSPQSDEARKEAPAELSKQKAAKGAAVSLPVKQAVLDNGLTVLMNEDHRVPSVATYLVYMVGSGHEAAGKTGFAHLFEHLMFQGSAHYDRDYFSPFEPIGGEVNGNTSGDRTVYYEVVPSQYRELSLWMESDRLRTLLDALTQEKLDNQRDVVKNERRQRYEITPYGMAYWYLDEALYPVGHPYHHSTIGSHEDLTNASMDDVREFFHRYYVPANLGLVLVGDFDPDAMLAQVEHYFGDLPSGERAKPPAATPPEPTSAKHWVVEDEVQLPRAYYAWVTPALFEPGDAELDLLSSVLTSGKTSRLYNKLVYTDKIAKDVAAYQMSERLNGGYVIQATAAPGVTIDQLAQALEVAVEEALASPITDAELERAKNQYKKGFYHRLESVESRASLIGTYFLHTGRGDYVEEDLKRYTSAQAVDVLTTGRKYLNFDRAVRLDFVPGKKTTPVKKLETPRAEEASR